MMRKFLVTKFICSKCGNNLNLTYDRPPGGIDYENGEPTGAAKVDQVVVIEPCECVTRQVDEIKKATKILFGTIGE